MPNGRRIDIGANPRGNDRQRRTDADLHSHAGPKRIPRIWRENIHGMLDSDVNAFPVFSTIPNVGGGDTTQTVMSPGHTRIPKIIYRPPNGVGSNLSDDTMQVDAFSLGGPV